MTTFENSKKTLYQWDLNQRLLIDGYPAGTEVHFANRQNGTLNAPESADATALVVDAYAEGDKVYADIPNSLLQTAGELLVYIYPESGDEAHTARRTVLPIIARSKPSDYVYTETEVKRWETLANQIEKIALAARECIDKFPLIPVQAYGAVGDGKTDDTAAIQAALNAGGHIYFPAGRYKVTSRLTAAKSCKISMFKPYPSNAYGEDQPLTSNANGIGARIECYGTDEYGFVFGDGIELDGFFIRAMAGFRGVLLKFDGELGCRTYPSQTRLSHLIADCDISAGTSLKPLSLFDYVPSRNYFHVLDDVRIGNHSCYATYGFRLDISASGRDEAYKWSHSGRITDMNIDVHSDYPFYFNGNGYASNWYFDGLVIQVYPDCHRAVMTLKNMRDTVFVGAYLWDFVNTDGDLIVTQNVIDTACFGCNEPFDSINEWLDTRMSSAKNLNLSNLTMSVAGEGSSGDNVLTLSDGTREKSVSIPSVTITDEQIGTSVSSWMDANAAPTEVVGRNKFNPNDKDCISGHYYTSGNYTASDMMTTGYISAVYGDHIRVSVGGVLSWVFYMYAYDADKNLLGRREVAPGSSFDFTVDIEGAVYIRLAWNTQSNMPAYEDRATAEVCITVNDPNISYTPYAIELVGGIGSFIILQSPDGTQYKLSVANGGALSAIPLNTDGEDGSSIDVPSGVANWRLLIDYTSTEEVAANTGMLFETDDDGNAFACKEIIIQWYCPASASAYATFKINGCTTQPGYFWSGNLMNTSGRFQMIKIEAMTDACVCYLLTNDYNPTSSRQPVWYTKDGAFDAIRSLQLTMFVGTYPVGHTIKIWGR